jgi:hypothetical protein
MSPKRKSGQVVSSLARATAVAHEAIVHQSNHQGNSHFMKKIPKGSEAATVLIGEMESLENVVTFFIRLDQALLLDDLTEVPLPTKFIFLLLHPPVKSFGLYIHTFKLFTNYVDL